MNIKRIITLLFCITMLINTLVSQHKPKLIVGITIDQMKQEYIYRFWDRYGDDGFKKIVRDGHMYVDAHYSYKPTYTAPGHASIYTGTTPAVHGIIGNNWYDKISEKSIYCAKDDSVNTVGSTSAAGQMSPHRMISSTISDEMRLSSGMKAKSIGISLKDRGAILPAGHAATGAYWYDGATGRWITSSYYTDELADWVTDFNARSLTSNYLATSWETLYPIETYKESLADNNPFESPFKGEETPTFPHDLVSILSQQGLSLLPKTPFGNSYTKDMAIAAVIGEGLGADEHTDMLAVSFSSTDYIGHQFGPRSIELEDAYLRLDQDIAELINFLNEYIGPDEYLIFVTADHGAAETPLYLQNFNIPAGYFNIEGYKNGLKNHVDSVLGDGLWIKNMSNDQIFLNHALIAQEKMSLAEVSKVIIDFSLSFEGVSNVLKSDDLLHGYYEHNTSLWMTQRGYHQRRSGDLHIIMEPGWMTYFRQGTTHGSSYTYDSHVPLLFYGAAVKKGKTYRRAHVIDIAPTIAALLQITLPNGASGRLLEEIFNN